MIDMTLCPPPPKFGVINVLMSETSLSQITEILNGKFTEDPDDVIVEKPAVTFKNGATYTG